MNWGIKIILSFIIFAAGVISMVAISISNNTDLVSDNYYEKEIKYQNEIDMMNRSAFLKDKIFSELSADEYTVKSDDREFRKDLSGEIYFYRADDASKDFTVRLDLNNDGIQKIKTRDMKRGLWKVKFNLQHMSQNYIIERNLFLE